MNDEAVNILVVDDEQIVLDSINKHLRKEAVTLHTALSVKEALTIMDTVKIDIVLTDLMMPDTDGLEFMKMVKDLDPATPVIMITGYATVNTALQATQLGAFDYVAKPFSKKELLGVVRRAIDLTRAAAGKSEGEATGRSHGDTLRHKTFKTIGNQSWLVLQEDGLVLLGVEHSFLHGVGKIQTLYLPEVGDEIRQGSVYLRIFSTDLSSHNILSPLTGTVIEVNQKVIDHPNSTLEDPYGDGWLVKLKPTRFEEETRLLGLG